MNVEEDCFAEEKKAGSSSRLESRVHNLAQLVAMPENEARDLTLAGRLRTISRLQTARLTEIDRGRMGSWLYDLNRHLALCRSLRGEYEALGKSLNAVDALIWKPHVGMGGDYSASSPAPAVQIGE